MAIVGTGHHIDPLKKDAVAQITEWGTPIREVPEQPGVSLHALSAGRRKFGKTTAGDWFKPNGDGVCGRASRTVSRPGILSMPTHPAEGVPSLVLSCIAPSVAAREPTVVLSVLGWPKHPGPARKPAATTSART